MTRDMTKAELRRQYLEMRRSLTPAQRSARSEQAASRLFEEFDFGKLAVVHCFISLAHKGEIDTSIIFERIWNEYPSICTLVPRMDPGTGEIDAIPYAADTELVENDWTIPEPAAGEPADPKAIDLVVVPGLVFDSHGHRVGYGGGYYDRFLARCRTDCIKAGISLFPLIDEIGGVHDGDVSLDAVIMPGKATFFGQNSIK